MSSRRPSYLEVLHDSSAELFSTTIGSEEHLFRVVESQLQEIFGDRDAGIFRYDPQNGCLRRLIGIGMYSQKKALVSGLERIQPGEGASGLAFNTRKLVVVSNYASWDNRLRVLDGTRVKSAVACPLFTDSEGNVYGVLCCGDPAPKPPKHLVDMVEKYASLISLALQNIRLRAEMRSEIEERRRVEEERRHLQSHLDRASRVEAVATFASGIVHDFRNILAHIAARAQLLENMLSSEQVKEREHVRQILDACFAAKTLTGEIMKVVRPAKTEDAAQPCDLAKALEDGLNLVKAGLYKNITLHVDVPEAPLPVPLSEIQVRQILLNLIGNAMEAIGPSRPGNIWTTVALMDPSTMPLLFRSVFKARGGERFVCFCVRNDGPLIPEAILDRIFDPYFTTKEAGSGLGLAMVNRLVQDAGGHVFVENDPVRGVAFHICLPLITEDSAVSEAAHESAEEFAEKDRDVLEGLRVLLVEDDPLLRAMTEDMLRMVGCSVVTAGDGKEALAVFRNDPRRFDAIVSDHFMPEMSGLELLRTIRCERPDISAIILTGYVDEDTERTVKELGNAALLLKPVQFSTLTEALSRMKPPS